MELYCYNYSLLCLPFFIYDSCHYISATAGRVVRRFKSFEQRKSRKVFKFIDILREIKR